MLGSRSLPGHRSPRAHRGLGHVVDEMSRGLLSLNSGSTSSSSHHTRRASRPWPSPRSQPGAVRGRSGRPPARQFDRVSVNRAEVIGAGAAAPDERVDQLRLRASRSRRRSGGLRATARRPASPGCSRRSRLRCRPLPDQPDERSHWARSSIASAEGQRAAAGAPSGSGSSRLSRSSPGGQRARQQAHRRLQPPGLGVAACLRPAGGAVPVGVRYLGIRRLPLRPMGGSRPGDAVSLLVGRHRGDPSSLSVTNPLETKGAVSSDGTIGYAQVAYASRASIWEPRSD